MSDITIVKEDEATTEIIDLLMKSMHISAEHRENYPALQGVNHNTLFAQKDGDYARNYTETLMGLSNLSLTSADSVDIGKNARYQTALPGARIVPPIAGPSNGTDATGAVGFSPVTAPVPNVAATTAAKSDVMDAALAAAMARVDATTRKNPPIVPGKHLLLTPDEIDSDDEDTRSGWVAGQVYLPPRIRLMSKARRNGNYWINGIPLSKLKLQQFTI